MDLIIERVSMPEIIRSKNKYMLATRPVCELLKEVGTSIFLPEADPKKSRKHYVYFANKIGKELGKEFVVAIESKKHAAKVLENGKPVINADGSEKVTISIEPGIRVFLTGLKEAEKAPEVFMPAETEE